MKFKYRAFIENTPEMREWLEGIGYNIYSYNQEDKYINATCLDEYKFGEIEKEPIFETFNEEGLNTLYNSINCLGNPSLFKAVTAVRDDSDMGQWFVSNEKIPGNYVPKPGFNGNPTIDLEKWWYYEWILSNLEKVSSHRYHKATREELIEHFKK